MCVCFLLSSYPVSSYLSVRVRVQDGRAEVVANDAGDRITPAVVAYRDDEQVCPQTCEIKAQLFRLLLLEKADLSFFFSLLSYICSDAAGCWCCSQAGTGMELRQHRGESQTALGQKVPFYVLYIITLNLAENGSNVAEAWREQILEGGLFVFARFDHPETQLHRSQTKCPVSSKKRLLFRDAGRRRAVVIAAFQPRLGDQQGGEAVL